MQSKARETIGLALKCFVCTVFIPYSHSHHNKHMTFLSKKNNMTFVFRK